MKIEYTTSPTQADIQHITDQINAETAEYGSAEPFAFFCRDIAGAFIAGANGYIIYGTIYTEQLWVAASYRHQGYVVNSQAIFMRRAL